MGRGSTRRGRYRNGNFSARRALPGIENEEHSMNAHTPPPSNHITAADIMSYAQELGKQAGQGKDTQIKFLLKVAEGGYHNAIDLAGNKHGKDIDDATKLAEA